MIHQSHTLDSAAFKPKRVHLEHRERDLLRPQIVQTNDSVHSHRNQGYQKRYFQPQGMSHELTFLTKKKIYIYIFFQRDKLQALLRVGVLKEAPVQRTVFTVMLPLGPFVSSGNEERAGVQVPHV